jgi:hypothetical protein
MSIATFRAESQALLGAACRPSTPLRELLMPLLTELKNHLLGLPGYRHGAPNGAVPLAHVCQMSLLSGRASKLDSNARGELSSSLGHAGQTNAVYASVFGSGHRGRG